MLNAKMIGLCAGFAALVAASGEGRAGWGENDAGGHQRYCGGAAKKRDR